MSIFKCVTFSVFLVMAIAFLNPAQADTYSETADVFRKSPVVRPFFDHCYGYVVFPTVGKGGFVIGGSYGTGQVFAQGKVTGTAKLIKASIGFQAGGQAFSQMVFIEDQRAYDEFSSGNLELDAVSAVAITAGVQAKGRHRGSYCRSQRRPGNRRPGPDELPQGDGGVRSRQRRTDVRSHCRRTEVQFRT